MNLKFLLFVLFCYGSVSTSAQVCTGDYILNTQTQVDAFLVDNPTCTSIDGSVEIYSLGTDLITNLDALANITSVTGTLLIVSNSQGLPISLAGLSSLGSLGALELYEAGDYLNAFDNEDGLQNLTSVGSLKFGSLSAFDFSVFDQLVSADYITFEYCRLPAYENLFPNVTSVEEIEFSTDGNQIPDITFTGFNGLLTAGNITFENMDFLYFSTFDGFHNLEVIEEDLTFNLAYIDTLTGFENLQSVNVITLDLYTKTDFPDFPSLNNLNGAYFYGSCELHPISAPDFNSLQSAGAMNYVYNFDNFGAVNLTTVESLWIGGFYDVFFFDVYEGSGFQQLSTIQGSLMIGGTPFSNLSFLDNLISIEEGVEIAGNPFLADCEIQALCNKLATDPSVVIISDNAPGCGSPLEVSMICGQSQVNGIAFADLDCDGMFNNADVLVNGATVLNQENIPVSASVDGSYLVIVPDNETTTLTTLTLPGYTSNSHVITTGTTPELFEDFNFTWCPDPGLHNLSVSMTSWMPPRPGFFHVAIIHVKNLGASVEEAMLTFDFSSIPGATISYLNDGVLNGTSLTWNIPAIGVFEELTFYAQIGLPASTPLGHLYTPLASISIIPSITDINETDNTYTFTEEVVGSFDPNDKRVNRPLIEHVEVQNNATIPLDYTIRFQNTGTASAITVRVTDHISELLDPGTYEMISASHSYSVTFDEDQNAEWIFENINLPDSTSDEEGSHGFIHFRIRTIPGVALSDVIDNQASIYFDFNEPIITNTTSTSFYTCPVIQITAPGQVCEGEQFVVSTTAGDFDTYSWSVNSIPSGSEDMQIITAGSPGTMVVDITGITDLCVASDEVNVEIIEVPVAPVITQEDNTLFATGDGVFSWEWNGEPIAGNTNSIIIFDTGTYGVTVQNEDCVSAQTTGIFIYNSIGEVFQDFRINVYPNPGTGLFTMTSDVLIEEVVIRDVTGQLVVVISNITSRSFPLSTHLVPGIYFLEANTGNKKAQQKIIIQ